MSEPENANSVLLFNVRRASLLSQDDGSDFLGLFYLAAALEAGGYDPWVFHGGVHEAPDVLARENACRRIVAVGFGCDFENRTAVEELSLFVKENYGFPVIVGGPQAIDLKEEFFARSKCDYVIRGEADKTLPELLNHIVRGKGAKEDIAGIVWMGPDGRIRANPDRPPVVDLDSLPLPAYHRSLHRGRMYGRAVFTGRGCPFSCAFCCQSRHKKRVRLRAMDKVLQEIEQNLERYPELNYITISDDTFTLNPQRVEAFCAGMAKLRLKRDFVWYCEGHVHLLARWPHMMDTMAQAGLARLQIGVETGCQEVLDKYGKQTTIEEIEAVVGRAVTAGIPQIATNLIIGGPGETRETIGRTADLAERLLRAAPGIIDIITGFLRPYPGTAISDNPRAFGLRVVDSDGANSIDDYPLLVPEGAEQNEILLHRVRVHNRIAEVMQDLMQGRKVPHQTILSQYTHALTYGITSKWHLEVFRKNPFLDEYFRLLARGAAVRFQDVPADELLSWRPQRTMEIRKHIDFDEGAPRLADYVLSPLEFELLLRASGKMRLEDVLREMEYTFGERFERKADLHSLIADVFREFDERRLVVFCRI